MNKEQIIEAVGQEYTKWFYDNAVPSVSGKPILNGEGILTRGEFINKCKTDSEFSERWGLKIEERELSLEEKYDWIEDNTDSYIKANSLDYDLLIGNISLGHIKFSLSKEAPTKLTTITYNDKKIESYE